VRYMKGSVSLGIRDSDLLHQVADARYITHNQLFQLARVRLVEFDRPVFNWRIRRLVNGGLLRKQVLPYLGADAYTLLRAAASTRWKSWGSRSSAVMSSERRTRAKHRFPTCWS